MKTPSKECKILLKSSLYFKHTEIRKIINPTQNFIFNKMYFIKIRKQNVSLNVMKKIYSALVYFAVCSIGLEGSLLNKSVMNYKDKLLQ